MRGLIDSLDRLSLQTTANKRSTSDSRSCTRLINFVVILVGPFVVISPLRPLFLSLRFSLKCNHHHHSTAQHSTSQSSLASPRCLRTGRLFSPTRRSRYSTPTPLG